MSNQLRTVIYIGVTSDLRSRVEQHKWKTNPERFTARYNTTICVYYENHSTIVEAIAREKQLKKWNRNKKNDLISAYNPTWKDLWSEIEAW